MKKLLAAIFAGLFALSMTAPVIAQEKKDATKAEAKKDEKAKAAPKKDEKAKDAPKKDEKAKDAK